LLKTKIETITSKSNTLYLASESAINNSPNHCLA